MRASELRIILRYHLELKARRLVLECQFSFPWNIIVCGLCTATETSLSLDMATMSLGKLNVINMLVPLKVV